jgi:hypothetical protein
VPEAQSGRFDRFLQYPLLEGACLDVINIIRSLSFSPRRSVNYMNVLHVLSRVDFGSLRIFDPEGLPEVVAGLLER